MLNVTLRRDRKWEVVIKFQSKKLTLLIIIKVRYHLNTLTHTKYEICFKTRQTLTIDRIIRLAIGHLMEHNVTYLRYNALTYMTYCDTNLKAEDGFITITLA